MGRYLTCSEMPFRPMLPIFLLSSVAPRPELTLLMTAESAEASTLLAIFFTIFFLGAAAADEEEAAVAEELAVLLFELAAGDLVGEAAVFAIAVFGCCDHTCSLPENLLADLTFADFYHAMCFPDFREEIFPDFEPSPTNSILKVLVLV